MDFNLSDPYPETPPKPGTMRLTIPTAEGPLVYFSENHQDMAEILQRLICFFQDSLEVVRLDSIKPQNIIDR
jgi:hypothetical protein